MKLYHLFIAILRSLPLSPEWTESLLFFLKLNYWPNLSSPRCFNEKILISKLNPAQEIRTEYADKLRARDHVKSCIGEEHLIPLLHHGPSITAEEIHSLGDDIVVKTNHDSGSVYIIEENTAERSREIAENVRKALAVDFGAKVNEPLYSRIEPAVMVEKKLPGPTGTTPNEYKIYCIRQEDGSQTFYVVAHRHRGTSNYFYSMHEEDLTPLDLVGFHVADFPEPDLWPVMRHIAEQLSKDLSYVRIDIYSSEQQIYFGEMSFFPGAGRIEFTRSEGPKNGFDYEMGQLWHYPLNSQNNS